MVSVFIFMIRNSGGFGGVLSVHRRRVHIAEYVPIWTPIEHQPGHLPTSGGRKCRDSRCDGGWDDPGAQPGRRHPVVLLPDSLITSPAELLFLGDPTAHLPPWAKIEESPAGAAFFAIVNKPQISQAIRKTSNSRVRYISVSLPYIDRRECGIWAPDR